MSLLEIAFSLFLLSLATIGWYNIHEERQAEKRLQQRERLAARMVANKHSHKS
jgi:hypothetical protein